jgi:flagellar hook-associated protein 2
MANLGLSGLASGVDTASIVAQLMALERQGSSRLQLRQKGITAQQTAFKDLKAKLDALKAAAADLRSASTWAATQTTESSDPTRVSAANTGGAPIGGYSIQVAQLASAAQKTYGWTPSAAASQLTLTGGAAPITLDLAADATITDVAATINGRADLPVYAAVVGGDKLVLSSRVTGATADFSAVGAQLAGPSATVAGRNAQFYVDGSATLTERASNVVEDVIPGVRLTLKAVSATPASIVVSAPGIDRSQIKDEVKAFVEAYNAVVVATRARTDEKTVKDAKTDADAVKGQLFGDSGLNGMLARFRTGMTTHYTGLGNPISLDDLGDIGITTGKVGATSEESRKGTLVLDEAKLMAALEGDAQGVRRLLGGAGVAGFAQDVEAMAGAAADMLDDRLESADSLSRRLTQDLAKAETRLTAKEKRLTAKFAAMELGLQAAQTQQAWLEGQLAGLQYGV